MTLKGLLQIHLLQGPEQKQPLKRTQTLRERGSTLILKHHTERQGPAGIFCRDRGWETLSLSLARAAGAILSPTHAVGSVSLLQPLEAIFMFFSALLKLEGIIFFSFPIFYFFNLFLIYYYFFVHFFFFKQVPSLHCPSALLLITSISQRGVSTHIR